jgi:hypothetical protein
MEMTSGSTSSLATGIDPQRVPYIRQYVAADMVELKEKVFRTVARSKPRDYLGAYSTEQFYHAENRNKAAEAAKQGLQAILGEYGIIVENVALMDYRFNPDYQKIITDKRSRIRRPRRSSPRGPQPWN